MLTLVTGANGCLGSNICKHLIAQGHSVRALVLPGTTTLAIDDLDVEIVHGDITKPDTLPPAMDGCEWVFHTAAVVSYWKGHWDISHAVNVEGTKNVINAVRQSGVKRLIHTSSKAAIANALHPDERPDESYPPDPNKQHVPYHVTKWESEQAVIEAVNNGLDAVICNPTPIFGERDVNLNAARIFKGVQSLSPFYPAAGGSGISDADDVALAHIQAAIKGRTGERYLLNNANLPAREYLTLAAEVIGARKPSIPIPYPLTVIITTLLEKFQSARGKQPFLTPDMNFMRREYMYASSDKARRELGYGTTPPRESMEKAYRWLTEHNLF